MAIKIWSEVIKKIDSFQAKRFDKLEGDAREIAIDGIRRHFRNCKKSEVGASVDAIREIIDDAIIGQSVFDQTNTDRAELIPSWHKS